MITKISISNVASYKESPVMLETDKKINFVYGLNGTGKTTISNYLADRTSVEFQDCSIEGLSDEKILVYNQNFIERNFYETPTQRGIFTLSSENKEAKDKISKAEERIKEINSEIENKTTNSGLQIDLKKKEEELQTLRKATELTTWKIKTDYTGGDRILEFCLDGKKKIKKVLEHIEKIDLPKNKPEKSIEDLKREAEATPSENAKIYDENEIKVIGSDFKTIEEDSIFQDVIVGNEDLQIAGLINELNNSDWVKKSLNYIEKPQKDNEICPLCQKRTISKELFEQIESYFDEKYKEELSKLNNLKTNYSTASESLSNRKAEYLNNDFIKNKKAQFSSLFNDLSNKLKNNLAKIDTKITNPSQIINLEKSDTEKNELNNFLETILEEVREHNSKIQNREETKKDIVKTFWQIMRWDYDPIIKNYKTQKNKFEKERQNIDNEIKNLNQEKKERGKIIKEEQKKTINIDEAIDNINGELKYFASDSFEIVKAGKDSYKLQRENEAETNFKTLSEGEKTIISFLYFLEICKGREEENETFNEKIVVIDDPISSLSHVYIFNIAHLIRKIFFSDNYKQVFVLTHNLYFFHDLLYRKSKDETMLFRITKTKNNGSSIESMERNDIQNDYQAYWQILKDHNNGKAPDTLLANSMRNILEHFFSFINKESFNEITQNIEEKEKYSFFVRYINKESHSDAINISDTKDIDPEIFKEAFRKIFEEAGYKEHYNKMMN